MSTEKDLVKAQNAAAQAATQARNEQQALDYFNAMDNYYLRQYQDQVNKTLGDQIARDQYEDAITVSDIQKDMALRQFDLSEERYQEQLKFTQEAYETSKQGLQSQYEDTVRSYEDQIDDQQRLFDQEVAQAGFNQAEIQQRKDQLKTQFGQGGLQATQDELSLRSARSALQQRSDVRNAEQTLQQQREGTELEGIKAQRDLIKNTRVQRDLVIQNLNNQADLEEARAITNRDSQLANIAFQRQGKRIEKLSAVGKATARGRKGVSATRSLNTTLALSGINMAQLTKQTFFVNEQYDQASQAVALRKQDIGFQDAIQKLEEANALGGLTRQQADLTARSAYQTAVRAAEGGADAREAKRLDDQEAFLASLATNKFTVGTAEADLQLERLAYALGFSEEQLQMNKDRLADSLVSAAGSLDDQLLALERAKYAADYTAHAARMLPPEFAPDARRPYDVPLPEYIEPRPGAAPAPAFQAQYVAPPPSNPLASALTIGAGVAAVASIPFTLGASGAVGMSALGLGGMTAAQAGAAATGLGIASGGLLSTGQFVQQQSNYNYYN